MTDGPFAETKEQIGGILILEARDLDHAVELISKHPGAGMGPWEIRPAADLDEMVREFHGKRRSSFRTTSQPLEIKSPAPCAPMDTKKPQRETRLRRNNVSAQ